MRVVLVLEDSFFLSLGLWQMKLRFLEIWLHYFSGNTGLDPFSVCALISTSSNSDLIGKKFQMLIYVLGQYIICIFELNSNRCS